MVVINVILSIVVWAVCIIILLIGIATCIAMTIMTMQYAWYVLLLILGRLPKDQDHSCHCGLPFENNTQITITIKKEN